jgi:hypothetical protein
MTGLRINEEIVYFNPIINHLPDLFINIEESNKFLLLRFIYSEHPGVNPFANPVMACVGYFTHPPGKLACKGLETRE